IQAAKNIQLLVARKDPAELPEIHLDVAAILRVLKSQVQTLEITAEQAVKAHIAKQHENDFEDWISRGQKYLNNNECPFCGQGLGGLKLIDAYRAHFRKAYTDLKQDMAAAEVQVAKELSEAKLDALVS